MLINLLQGRVFGITLGCLLGMVPLLFMKDKKDAKPKEEDLNTTMATTTVFTTPTADTAGGAGDSLKI